MKLSPIFLAIPLLVFSLCASAQSVTPPQVNQTDDANPADTLISVQTVAAVRMASNPAPLSADMPEITAPETTLKHGPIRISGYIRQIEYNGQTINQISWTSVSATVEDTKRVSGLSAPLTTQFQYDKDTIPPKTALSATGDKILLNEAIRALFDVGTPEQESNVEEDGKDDTKEPTPQTPQSNDIASGYEKSDYVAPVETPEAAALPVAYGETTDGCSPRIDWDAGNVNIQTATTKTEGGAVSTTGECSDSAITYAINRSYARCPSDETNAAEAKAYPMYIAYWTDGEGSNHDLTDCLPDYDQYFDITSTTEGCSVSVDLVNSVVKPRSREIYTNANNTEIEVSICAEGDAEAIPVTFTTDGCSIKHDYDDAVSYKLHRAFYILDGIETNALGCSETGVTYPHDNIRFINGIAVCNWLEAPATLTAYPQDRIRITTEDGDAWISECAPIEAAGSPFALTTDSCEFTFFHDFGAGVSYGTQKTYYVADNDVRVYLTNCQQSQATYEHQREGGEVHGWLYADPAKTAQEYTALYIDTEWGRREVANATIEADTPHTPYVYVSTGTVQTGTSIYEGCEGYYETALTETYTRPDNTSYLLPIGPGDPAGPRDVCDIVVTNKTIQVGAIFGSTGSSTACLREWGDSERAYSAKNYIAYRQRAATKTVTTNHETAEVLSTVHSWGGITNGGYIRAPACFGSNQATLNTEYISNWWFYTGYGNPQTKLHTLPTDW